MILQMRKVPSKWVLFFTLFSIFACEKEVVIPVQVESSQPTVTAASFEGATHVNEIDYREALIHWQNIEEAVSYSIFRVDDSQLEFKAHVVGWKKNQYKIKGLEPNTNYKFVVRAMNSEGIFDNNFNTVSFTTLAYGTYFNQLSLNFDGTKSVELANSDDLLNKSYGVSFWFKTSNIQTDARLVNFKTNTGGSSFNISLSNIGIRIGYRDVGDNYKFIEYTYAYNDGLWNHVYASYSGSKYKLFVNGVLQAQIADTNKGHGDQKAYIGSFNHSSNFFIGLIDEVALFNGVMNNTQVEELFSSGQSSELRTHSKWNTLISWYRMGDSTGDSELELKDVMGNNLATPQSIVIGDYLSDAP